MLGWLFGKKPVVALPPGPQAPMPIPDAKLPTPQERFVHLGIIVGHTKLDGGAVMNDGMSEYQYGRKVADAILKRADSAYPKIKVTVILRDGIGIHGAYDQASRKGCDAVIELHFNASNKLAAGTLTLCSQDLNDIDFAHEIHERMCRAFLRDGASMGVNVIGRSVRGSPNVYAFPIGVNCLVEPFFGDNPRDAQLGIDRMDEYADALLLGVQNWAIKNDLISSRQS